MRSEPMFGKYKVTRPVIESPNNKVLPRTAQQTQRGNVIPLTIFMFTLASLASVYMINITQTSRQQTMSNTVKNSAFYAMEGAAQHARVALENYVTTRFDEAFANQHWEWTSNTTHFLDPSNTSLNSGVNVNNFFSNISPVSGSLSNTHDDLDYEIFFFEDKNLNGEQDTGEEGFVLVSIPESGGDSQNYTYRYSATVVGKKKNVARSAIITGEVSFGLQQTRFSKYSLFTNTHAMKSGNSLTDIWFTQDTFFDGPVHTNGKNGTSFNFAATGNTSKSATFKGDVSSVNEDINYLYYEGKNKKTFSDTPNLTDKNPKGSQGGQIRVAPDFHNGYERGVESVDMPANNISQTRAALGGALGDDTPVSNNEIRKAVGLPENGNSIPNDVYVPKDNNGNPTGGIFIQGDVEDALLFIDENDRQVIKVTQKIGSKTVHKEITIDTANNETIIKTFNGSSNWPSDEETLSGVPNGMLQVEGKIKSLGGPARQGNSTQKQDPAYAPAAIHKKSKLTISASDDIIIKKDLKYQDDPRGEDGVWGGVDNLKAENMLGIFSSNGNVRIGNPAPYNIEIHGSILAGSKNEGMFVVDDYQSRSYGGTVNVLGGIIQNHYGAHGTFSNSGMGTGYGRNYQYDRRFMKSAPPYFPSTGKTEKAPPTTSIMDWKEIKSKDL